MNSALSRFRGNLLKKTFSVFCILSSLLIVGTFFLQLSDDFLVHAQDLEEHSYTISNNSNNLKIFPPQTVKIIYGDNITTHFTYSNSVQEVLEEKEIEYSEHDIIKPGLDFELTKTKVIKIHAIEKKFEEIFVNIPFWTENINDATLNYGYTSIEQYGKNGLQKDTYQKIYMDGELISQELYSSEIIENPTKQIIRVGTKKTALEGRNCDHWYGVVDSLTSDANERSVLKFLIACESKCNAGANNRNLYLGLLQFHRNTFNHYGNGDIWDGAAQIQAALQMIRGGGLNHHWPACSRKYSGV